MSSAAEPSVIENFFDHFPRGGKFLVLTHNHPDPDSISSAAALQLISRVLGNAKTTIGYGGVIGRAENAHMVKYLNLKLTPIDKIKLSEFDAIAMVDTQPRTGNNSLPSSRIPDLVIDHHPVTKPSRSVPFLDIREGYGATASILTQYLFHFGLDVDQNLATALLYGIKSETQDLAREAYPIDIECYLKLFPLANKKLLSKIVNSRVPRSYFYFLSKAISNAQILGNAIVTRLDEVENPDIIPEIADLLLRLEGATWALCMGYYQESIYLSIRTTNIRKNAGRLMKQLTKSKGTGGGHALIAGGKIDMPGEAPWTVHETMDQLQVNFLKKVQKYTPTKVPLIATDDTRSGKNKNS
ncbi:MAG: DHH family phosphoesterase [Bdellovibrionales bacterium]|nr:DHH family phosphoesterase [Bdellovibrionales bacterium]